MFYVATSKSRFFFYWLLVDTDTHIYSWLPKLITVTQAKARQNDKKCALLVFSINIELSLDRERDN